MNITKDKEAKRDFIRAFHDEAERRIEFLLCLEKEKHRHEALTLCLSYIDSFAQWLCWPCSKSGENFVRVVANFGGNPLMGLVNPLQAIRSFEVLNGSWPQISRIIGIVFPGPDYELILEDSFLSKLKAKLEKKDFDLLKSECWKGILAASAYYYLRNPSIHSFGTLELSFSKTFYRGSLISDIGFSELYEIVKNIHKELRRRSENNLQWFGNDKIVGIGA
ncbi:hypothetical protein ACJ77P_10285 [Syntrophus buswellii]|uniref:hypothetical protein n=1 Tax=Syntrophus buswellii TaxID=43774 RepID=UPI0038D3C0B4